MDFDDYYINVFVCGVLRGISGNGGANSSLTWALAAAALIALSGVMPSGTNRTSAVDAFTNFSYKSIRLGVNADVEERIIEEGFRHGEIFCDIKAIASSTANALDWLNNSKIDFREGLQREINKFSVVIIKSFLLVSWCCLRF